VSEVLFESRDGLAVITLNRPAKLNALTVEMFQELLGHIERIEKSPEEFGCVLLRGAGKCFCAGHDLAQISTGESSPVPNFQPLLVERLANVPPPLVVAVHSHCYTGALELALAGDIILAAENAKFADTHGKWGMSPFWGMSQRLPRRIGPAKAAEMMFTAATIHGAEAERIGLANRCFPDASFEADVAAFCQAILANSWFSHRANKRLMIDTDGMPLSSGLAHEVFHHPGVDPDMHQRIARFLGKSGD
jgi:enoyl-CoA hydratase